MIHVSEGRSTLEIFFGLSADASSSPETKGFHTNHLLGCPRKLVKG